MSDSGLSKEMGHRCLKCSTEQIPVLVHINLVILGINQIPLTSDEQESIMDDVADAASWIVSALFSVKGEAKFKLDRSWA